MECPTAKALFEDYIRATRDHVEAAVKLSNLVGSQEQFADAKRCATETYAKCEAAFSALAKHRAEYNCLERQAAKNTKGKAVESFPEAFRFRTVDVTHSQFLAEPLSLSIKEKYDLPLGPFAAGLGDQRIVTTLCPGGKERMRRLMEMVLHHRLDLTPLLTHRFKLDKITDAYKLFAEQRDGVMKVAIEP